MQHVDDDMRPHDAVLIRRGVFEVGDAEAEVGVGARGVGVCTVLIRQDALMLLDQRVTPVRREEHSVDHDLVEVGVHDAGELRASLHLEFIRVALAASVLHLLVWGAVLFRLELHR